MLPTQSDITQSKQSKLLPNNMFRTKSTNQLYPSELDFNNARGKYETGYQQQMNPASNAECNARAEYISRHTGQLRQTQNMPDAGWAGTVYSLHQELHFRSVGSENKTLKKEIARKDALLADLRFELHKAKIQTKSFANEKAEYKKVIDRLQTKVKCARQRINTSKC